MCPIILAKSSSSSEYTKYSVTGSKTNGSENHQLSMGFAYHMIESAGKPEQISIIFMHMNLDYFIIEASKNRFTYLGSNRVTLYTHT